MSIFGSFLIFFALSLSVFGLRKKGTLPYSMHTQKSRKQNKPNQQRKQQRTKKKFTNFVWSADDISII